MTARKAALVAGVAGMVALVVVFWHYLMVLAVVAGAWRMLRRDTRRPRPRSSWSSLGRTAALLFASWNSRWLRPTTRITAKVPASAAGRGGPCPECGEHPTITVPAPARDFGEIPF